MGVAPRIRGRGAPALVSRPLLCLALDACIARLDTAWALREAGVPRSSPQWRAFEAGGDEDEVGADDLWRVLRAASRQPAAALPDPRAFAEAADAACGVGAVDAAVLAARQGFRAAAAVPATAAVPQSAADTDWHALARLLAVLSLNPEPTLASGAASLQAVAADIGRIVSREKRSGGSLPDTFAAAAARFALTAAAAAGPRGIRPESMDAAAVRGLAACVGSGGAGCEGGARDWLWAACRAANIPAPPAITLTPTAAVEGTAGEDEDEDGGCVGGWSSDDGLVYAVGACVLGSFLPMCVYAY